MTQPPPPHEPSHYETRTAPAGLKDNDVCPECEVIGCGCPVIEKPDGMHCPACGIVWVSDSLGGEGIAWEPRPEPSGSAKGSQLFCGAPSPPRLFTEEDVRPLWEAMEMAVMALHGKMDYDDAYEAWTAFPAPDHWDRVWT